MVPIRQWERTIKNISDIKFLYTPATCTYKICFRYIHELTRCFRYIYYQWYVRGMKRSGPSILPLWIELLNLAREMWSVLVYTQRKSRNTLYSSVSYWHADCAYLLLLSIKRAVTNHSSFMSSFVPDFAVADHHFLRWVDDPSTKLSSHNYEPFANLRNSLDNHTMRMTVYDSI